MGRASNRKWQRRNVTVQQPPCITLEQVQDVTDKYTSLPALIGADCFHMTAVLDYALDKAGIPHSIVFGCYPQPSEKAAIENLNSHYLNQMHTWITVETSQGKAIVDYRARATVGPEGSTPNGVFLLRSYPFMRYKGWNASKIFSEQAVLHLMDPLTYPQPERFGEEQLEAMTRPEYSAYAECLKQATPESMQVADDVRKHEAGASYGLWDVKSPSDTLRELAKRT